MVWFRVCKSIGFEKWLDFEYIWGIWYDKWGEKLNKYDSYYFV